MASRSNKRCALWCMKRCCNWLLPVVGVSPVSRCYRSSCYGIQLNPGVLEDKIYCLVCLDRLARRRVWRSEGLILQVAGR